MKSLSTPQRNLVIILALLLVTFGAARAQNPERVSCIAPLNASITEGQIHSELPGVASKPAAGVVAAENIFRCMNGNRYRAVTELATPDFLRRAFGIKRPEDAPTVLRGVPPFVLHFLSNPRVHGDRSVSVELIYQRETGAHMLVHERWFFLFQGGQWRLSRLEPLTILPGGPRVIVRAVVANERLSLSPNRLAAGTSLVFNVRNYSDHPREFAVFKLPEGADATLGEPTSVPAGAHFVGVTIAAPGRSSNRLILVGLKPGQYVTVSSATAYGGVSATPPITAPFEVYANTARQGHAP